MPDDFAGMGHNQGPQIDSDFEALSARGKELADAAERLPEIKDNDTAGKVTTFIKQIKLYKSDADNWRKAKKQPHLEAGKKIDADGKILAGVVDNALNAASTALNKYLAEQQRKADEERRRQEAEARRMAEEAERLRKEAEASNDAVLVAQAEQAKQASEEVAKAPERTRVTSDAGASASVQKFWDYKVNDAGQIPVAIFRKYLKPEDIDKMIRAAVRAGERNIKGVEIFENTRPVIR
jgi:hypothetical protein